MSEGEDILYEVRDRITVITFNIPKKLNALNGAQYLLLAKLIDRADKEEDTLVTLIQSTGRYFSAGANFADKSLANASPQDLFSHEYWLQNFLGRNVYITDLFHNHTKVLVAALNGPVVGLTTGLISLSDLTYAIEEEKVFLLAPFTNLGLVSEGASSVTLFLRLGWAKAAETLLFSKPVSGKDLNRLGFFNKTYDGENLTTEQFNAKVFDELTKLLEGLHEPSILEMKQLLKANRDQAINSAGTREAVQGFNKWIEGVPQLKFAQLLQKERKNKL